MSIIQAIILGLVQGLAEFLPISSSGHLAIIQYFFGINPDQVLLFAVLLHVGTLISVFIVYWRDIVELILELGRTIKDVVTGKGLRVNANPTRKLGFLIIVATIPTALMGILFNDIFEGLYNSLISVGCALIVTGIMLFFAERINSGEKYIKGTTFKNALFIGVLQGIAICPGISRSGATLVGGLVSNLKRDFAVKFAFLISIPSILGSVAVEMPDAVRAGVDGSMVLPIIIGVVVSAISGLAAIKGMIKIVSKQKLSYFSIYVWIVGLGIILYSIFV